MSDLRLSGAELSRRFFAELVQPLLAQAGPGLRYAAARLGSGSDVLGLDDELSRDHDWGCRLTLLVDEEERDRVAPVRQLLEDRLPERFGGYPVRFPVTWDGLSPRCRALRASGGLVAAGRGDAGGGGGGNGNVGPGR